MILSFDITSANTFFLKFPLYHPSVGWKSLGNQPEIYQLSWFLIKIKIYYIGFVFFNGTKLWIGSLSLTNYFALYSLKSPLPNSFFTVCFGKCFLRYLIWDSDLRWPTIPAPGDFPWRRTEKSCILEYFSVPGKPKWWPPFTDPKLHCSINPNFTLSSQGNSASFTLLLPSFLQFPIKREFNFKE